MNIERIAEKVHNAWWKEKIKQGFHSPLDCLRVPVLDGRDRKFSKRCGRCHSDMYPYAELPENIKDYDRMMVWAVLNAMGIEKD